EMRRQDSKRQTDGGENQPETQLDANVARHASPSPHSAVRRNLFCGMLCRAADWSNAGALADVAARSWIRSRRKRTLQRCGHVAQRVAGGERRREPGGFNSEQADDPGDTMAFGPTNLEIGTAFARRMDLRPYAGIRRFKNPIFDRRPITLDGAVEHGSPFGVD